MGTTDPAPAPIASKEPERGKNYFGLYLLAGGLKPYDMESDIETTTALAKTFYTPLRQHSVLSGQRLPSKFTQLPSKAPDQAKNISHSTPDGLGRELFSPDIMWWLGDWTHD